MVSERMTDDLYCTGQKVMTAQGMKNFDKIFGKKQKKSEDTLCKKKQKKMIS